MPRSSPWSRSCSSSRGACRLATRPSQLLLEAGLQPARARRAPAGRQVPAAAFSGRARPAPVLGDGGPGPGGGGGAAGRGPPDARVGGVVRGVLGLIVAAGLANVIVTPAVGGVPVHAWPGPALVFAGAGLLLAALVAAGDAFAGKLGSGGWRSPGGIAVVGLAALACTAPALAAAAWVASGVRGPVAPAAGPVLPEFVSVVLRHRPAAAHAGAAGDPGRPGGVFGAQGQRSADRRQRARRAPGRAADAQPHRGRPGRAERRCRAGPGPVAGPVRHRLRAASGAG